jgi:hypothetical protein
MDSDKVKLFLLGPLCTFSTKNSIRATVFPASDSHFGLDPTESERLSTLHGPPSPCPLPPGEGSAFERQRSNRPVFNGVALTPDRLRAFSLGEKVPEGRMRAVLLLRLKVHGKGTRPETSLQNRLFKDPVFNADP